MSGSLSAVQSLASLCLEKALGAHVTSVNFVGEHAAAALGDGRVGFMAPDGSASLVPVHAGAILCACSASGGAALLTGGDDGQVCLVTPAGAQLVERQGKWVDAVASRDGAVAYAFGKTVTIRTAGGERRFPMRSTVGGIASTRSGFAVAHRGGATLLEVADGEGIKSLHADGGHVAIAASPNGRFIVTATLDHSLCCWRVADGVAVHMRGYLAKPLSLSWTKRGGFIATSGYRRLVMWPMAGKGPDGKHADTLAPRPSLVTAVACHPSIDLVAVGYADGCIVFARQAIQVVLPVRAADGEEVTSLAFNKKGGLLTFGTAGGAFGLLDMRGVLQ